MKIKKVNIKCNKIFLIGFNKCGTTSLHYFFENNNIKSLHWDNGNIVNVFENNLKKGNKLLSGGVSVYNNEKYENIVVFSDITKHNSDKDAKDYYKQLDKDYPHSKFILNIRNVDNWINSREKHINGGIVKTLSKFHNCSHQELKVKWKKMFLEHIKDVKFYFQDRLSDLCIFDIENDNIDKIIEFLKNDYKLNKQYYKHLNKTK